MCLSAGSKLDSEMSGTDVVVVVLVVSKMPLDFLEMSIVVMFWMAMESVRDCHVIATTYDETAMMKWFVQFVVVVLLQPLLWLFSPNWPNLLILERKSYRLHYPVFPFVLAYCQSGRSAAHHHSLAERGLEKQRNEIHIV
jgi:hypothetical protein